MRDSGKRGRSAPGLAKRRRSKHGDVAIQGTPAAFRAKADSGNTVQSAFCPNCGSPVYKTSSGFADLLFFHAATLDDSGRYRPQSIVWARSRQPWDHLDPALPAQD